MPSYILNFKGSLNKGEPEGSPYGDLSNSHRFYKTETSGYDWCELLILEYTSAQEQIETESDNKTRNFEDEIPVDFLFLLIRNDAVVQM